MSFPNPFFNPPNIPEELKTQPRWVLWRIVVRDGKCTKVPITAQTGTPASCDKPATWSAYEEAEKAYQRGGVVGLGFMLGGPYVGVDLDNCRNVRTGEIEAWAWEIIRALDSYTEISPSGRGVHIIAKGKLPAGRRRKGGIEMYDSGRYFTITGRLVK